MQLFRSYPQFCGGLGCRQSHFRHDIKDLGNVDFGVGFASGAMSGLGLLTMSDSTIRTNAGSSDRFSRGAS
jgi:hypothetical protein